MKMTSRTPQAHKQHRNADGRESNGDGLFFRMQGIVMGRGPCGHRAATKEGWKPMRMVDWRPLHLFLMDFGGDVKSGFYAKNLGN